jgi:hypothetical protein
MLNGTRSLLFDLVEQTEVHLRTALQSPLRHQNEDFPEWSRYDLWLSVMWQSSRSRVQMLEIARQGNNGSHSCSFQRSVDLPVGKTATGYRNRTID